MFVLEEKEQSMIVFYGMDLLLVLDVIKYVNGQLDLMGFGSEEIMTNRWALSSPGRRDRYNFFFPFPNIEIISKDLQIVC